MRLAYCIDEPILEARLDQAHRALGSNREGRLYQLGIERQLAEVQVTPVTMGLVPEKQHSTFRRYKDIVLFMLEGAKAGCFGRLMLSIT